MPTLSVVLPCFNEASNIEATIDDVLSFFLRENINGEVLIVDDGSTDASPQMIENIEKQHDNVRVLRHRKNQGYGAALRTGLDAATGDSIGFMDSDGQFHAEDIGKLIALFNGADAVIGIRRHRADPWRRTLNASLYGWLVRTVLGIRVTDLNCGLKFYRRSVWSQIRPQYGTGALFNAEVFFRLSRLGKHWEETEVGHYPRRAGVQTGAKLRVILHMFWELFSLKKSLLTEEKQIARTVSEPTSH